MYLQKNNRMLKSNGIGRVNLSGTKTGYMTNQVICPFDYLKFNNKNEEKGGVKYGTKNTAL